MKTMTSRTLSVSIAIAPAAVYAFASNPAMLPKWAGGLCRSIANVDGEWLAETPQGRVKLWFAPQNDLGVLDHKVILPDGMEVYVPMRVVPNGDGCEVMLTLFRLPGMSEERFAEDAGLVEADLRALKDAVE